MSQVGNNVENNYPEDIGSSIDCGLSTSPNREETYSTSNMLTLEKSREVSGSQGSSTYEEACFGLAKAINYFDEHFIIDEAQLAVLRAALNLLYNTSRRHNDSEKNISADDLNGSYDGNKNKDGIKSLLSMVKMEKTTMGVDDALYALYDPVDYSGSDTSGSSKHSLSTLDKVKKKKQQNPGSVGIVQSAKGKGNEDKKPYKHKSFNDYKECFTCQVCHKMYVQRKYYEKHVNSGKCNERIGKKAFCRVCEFCNKSFTVKHLFYSHLKKSECRAKVSDALYCSICDQTFKQHGALQLHLEKEHLGSRPYRCIPCDVVFISLNEIYAHMDNHGLNTSCECSVCGIIFDNIQNLRIHADSVPSHLSANLSNRVCSVCHKTFRNKAILKHHMVVHTGLKPYKCEYCGKYYSQSGQLRNHERTHTGERRHMCSVCGKRFCLSAQLDVHMRYHTSTKPYVCNSCGNAYYTAAKLKIHERSHSGERPFICSICGKSFKDRSTLQLHSRLHTGETPYSCHVCRERFRRKDALINHKKKSYHC